MTRFRTQWFGIAALVLTAASASAAQLADANTKQEKTTKPKTAWSMLQKIKKKAFVVLPHVTGGGSDGPRLSGYEGKIVYIREIDSDGKQAAITFDPKQKRADVSWLPLKALRRLKKGETVDPVEIAKLGEIAKQEYRDWIAGANKKGR
jgi:hypothetical protein